VNFTDPAGVGIELAFEEEGDAASPGATVTGFLSLPDAIVR
jgi:hypothetical protein